MSDTPETDAAKWVEVGYNSFVVSASIASKLERERDEAREAIRALAEHGESEIQRITKECDEARNKMADALQEVDLRTLDFERMKKERDEAVESIMIILEENRHLADGEDCTLAKLKSVVPD